MPHAATPIGRLGPAVLCVLALAALILLAPSPGDAGARGEVGRELARADRALSSSVRDVRAGRQIQARRQIQRIRRHMTRGELATRRAAWSFGARRVSTTRGRRVIWLRSLSARQARASERLAMELPRARGQLRRSIALQVGRDVLGWRRAARRIELDARRFRGRSRQRTERALASFLRGRDRRATGLLELLEAQGGDVAGRYVLRELTRGQQTALSALRRLGEDAPTQGAQGGSTQQTASSPQVRQAPSSTPSAPAATPEPGTLLSDRFGRAYGPNNLITNHYAYLHHTDSSLPRSPNWEVTNGTLFHRGGTGWTGNPTACTADRYSETCTGSARFRMHSRHTRLGDVAMSARFRHNGFTESAQLPATSGDGIHLWLRHESQYRLYRVGVLRRNGQATIQKKCPGGSAGNGTYHLLAQAIDTGIGSGAWHDVTATARNVSGGVTITLRVNGTPLVSARDTGTGCAPITAPGRVGIRGDNSDFNVDDVLVKPL